MRVMKCKSCGKQANFSGECGHPVNVGEAAQETGFKFVLSYEHTIWLCPACFTSAHTMARGIKNILGQGDVVLNSILHEEEV